MFLLNMLQNQIIKTKYQIKNMIAQKSFLKLPFTLLVAGCLSACGPIYKTNYSYMPPKSSQGMMCITNCTSAQTNCEQLEELKKENCEHQSEIEYQLCKNSGDKYCIHKSCYSSEYGRCRSKFNECYQSCGGTVTTQQVCTAFCN